MIIVQLPTPILSFNKQITQVAWRVNYPDNIMYYQMQTENGISLLEGNWIIPSEVVESWGFDDNVVSEALILAEPWNNIN